MKAKDNTMGTKAAPRKEVAAKKNKSGNTKKHEGAVSAVATYVNYQMSQLDRGLCVASSSWPNRK